MKKIATTPSGRILVEMSEGQFEALSKIAGPPKPHPHQDSEESAMMSFAEKVNFVRPRIVKLAPKKPDSLIRAVKSMFNFTGGIDDNEAGKIVGNLKNEGIIQISDANRVECRQEV